MIIIKVMHAKILFDDLENCSKNDNNCEWYNDKKDLTSEIIP